MTSPSLPPPDPTPDAEIVQVAPFAAFVPRFEELLASATRLTVYFIHSRRWRENHDSAIRAMLARPGTTLEVFLPDLENHELMYSLEKHFDDGPLIPALVVDAYRFFSRLSREYGRPSEVWLFGRYPTYSFYRFDDHAIVAPYSNSVARKRLPALEITMSGLYGQFVAADIEDLKRECRRRTPADLETVIHDSSSI
jgi:hypothetical protein